MYIISQISLKIKSKFIKNCEFLEADMNKNNLDQKKLNGLLGVVSKKLGVPPEKLRSELEAGKFDSALSAMNRNDAAKFQQAVNNPQLVERMMSTPQAKALYKKLSGEK